MARRWRAAVAGAVLGVAAAAHGYILPSFSILRRLTEAREELKLVSVKIEGSASFHGPGAVAAAGVLGAGPSAAEVMGDGAVYLRLPGRCRLEVANPDRGTSAAAVFANGRRRNEGGPLAAIEVAIGQLCPIFANRGGSDGEGRAALERFLAGLKIDTRKTSLGRFGGQVAYVLGEPEEGRPQFWVYKDTFLPARLRFADAQGASWDVKLLDYTSPATGEWFPRVIEVASNGQLVFRFVGLRADARAKIDDRMF